jgi:hypothetical protein
MARSRMSWLMVAATVVLLVGCQTLTEEAPTEPTAVTEEKPTLAAITIPIILPASNPTPAPDPAATPAPGASPLPGIPLPGSPAPPDATPPPPAGGGGGGGGCGLPPGNPDHSCKRTSPAFLGDVFTAIDRVVDAYPDLFIRSDRACGNCYKIRDHQRYVEAVEVEMRAMGYCAHYDGEELAVKNTNDFSEQHDISTSGGYIRRGDKVYRATCWPAWF